MKKIVLPIIILVGVILLNSIVIASPLKPAIVGGSIVARSQFVTPFTRWESRPRYLTGEKLVLFAAPDEDNLWAIRLTYSARRVDLFQSIGDWETWLTSRLTTITNNVYTQVIQFAPAGASVAERTQLYVDAVSDPAFLAELTKVLRSQFNEHYSDILVMQGITMIVEKITLAQYQSSRE